MKTNKYCKDCKNTKPIDEFYKAGKSRQTRCKPCHNKYRKTCKISYVPKVYKTPFEKLPQDIKDNFITLYGTIPLSTLSRELGLNYVTVSSWKQKGFLNF